MRRTVRNTGPTAHESCYRERVTLHDEVRAAREALGMSQRKLAELAGIPRSQLSAFEAHGTNITLETLRKLVTALPNIQHLSLGVRDVQVNAALSDAAMQHALAELRRATDAVLALAGRSEAGAQVKSRARR